jgi:putative SOS response-associated peptidase YedK
MRETMCGRFTLQVSAAGLAEEFGIDIELLEHSASYNVAPTQEVLTLINEGDGPRPSLVKWGLVPHWAKGTSKTLINVRSETIAEKPTFKASFRRRRCLILADGFFEWRKEGSRKVPMYIRLREGRPFGFAGIYDRSETPEGGEVTRCAIITTESNELIGRIHDRMPVIVPREARAAWLDPNIQDDEELLPILGPFDPELMEAFEVSDLVNSPRNNTPEVIEPRRSITDW